MSPLHFFGSVQGNHSAFLIWLEISSFHLMLRWGLPHFLLLDLHRISIILVVPKNGIAYPTDTEHEMV